MPMRTTPHRPLLPARHVEEAMTRLPPALAVLAATLAALGEPADAPLARFAPVTMEETSLDPARAAEWAIALVHAVFHGGPRSRALTAATKGVGNAARGIRRALAKEAARRAVIARREATPLPVKKSLIAKLAA